MNRLSATNEAAEVVANLGVACAGKVAMAAFNGLFRLNVTRSRWGGQLAAVAGVP